MPPSATISDREALDFLEVEMRRRGDKTPARTATKIVLERKLQEERRLLAILAAENGPQVEAMARG